MKKALCVGLNKFQLPGNNLQFCVSDSRIMQGFSLGLGLDEVIVLNDATATKANAWAHLTALVEEARQGKLSYLGLAWSGHGSHYPEPQEADGLGECLICYDTRALGEDWHPATIVKDVELRDLLNLLPPTCLGEAWMDVCYSGGMDRDFKRFLHNPGNRAKAMRLSSGEFRAGLNSNIIMWEACSEAQVAADGAFTPAWAQAYREAPKSSRVEVLLRTRDILQARGYGQFPRLKCWNAAAQLPCGPQ